MTLFAALFSGSYLVAFMFLFEWEQTNRYNFDFSVNRGATISACISSGLLQCLIAISQYILHLP